MDEVARRAILARRARLLAASLAALGPACGPKPIAPPPSSAQAGPTAPPRSAGATPAGPGASGEPGAEPPAPSGPTTPELGAELADADRDGVPDARDACPTLAGVEAIDSMQAGCPARPCLSVAAPTTLQINAKIHFDHGRTELPASAAPVIDEIVRSLDAHPEMDLEIVGHADSSEPEQLGIARARRVLHALVARGLSPARFEASSEGSRRPAVEEKSAEGRAKNRRVEFVLRGAKRPLDLK